MSIELLQVLLVEDSEADIRLTREAMRDSKIACDLHVVQTGDAALDFLHQRGEHAAAPRPDLVILDLNLPGVSGREVLAAVKSDERLRAIPVAVLTTSAAETDVVSSYDLGANCFVTKPLGFEQFLEVVRAIESFWLGLVRLPPGP